MSIDVLTQQTAWDAQPPLQTVTTLTKAYVVLLTGAFCWPSIVPKSMCATSALFLKLVVYLIILRHVYTLRATNLSFPPPSMKLHVAYLITLLAKCPNTPTNTTDTFRAASTRADPRRVVATLAKGSALLLVLPER